MNDVPFHLTRMGRTFFESTMPALVRELERLNENLERVLPAVAANAEGEPKGEENQDPADRARPK